MSLRFALVIILAGTFIAFLILAAFTGTTIGVIFLGVLAVGAAVALWALDSLIRLVEQTRPEDRS